MTFNAGRKMIASGFIEWLSTTFRPENAFPITALIEATTQSPELLRCLFLDRGCRIGWKEFSNRLGAFRLFSSAGSKLSRDSTNQLSASLAIVTSMTPYEGLWTTEGLGFYYAANKLNATRNPKALLNTEVAGPLPRHSLIPLHSGMGLAFAWQQLHSVNQQCRHAELPAMLSRFGRLCRDNSVDGYAGASFEGIGLLASLLRPAMLPAIDKILSQTNSEDNARFWHGVGRSLYFSPASVLPCTSIVWPAISRALSVPPNETERRNAVSGLAWALTLVNIRDPDVVESFVRRFGSELAVSDAFANGVSSAAAVWQDWAPVSPILTRFCEYRPRTIDSKQMEQWNRHARGLCESPDDNTHGTLQGKGRVESLFRYESVRRA